MNAGSDHERLTAFVQAFRDGIALPCDAFVIDEAARSLPPSATRQAPHVDWRKMVGLQSISIHECFGINLDIVWNIVQNKLDPLEQACRKLLDG
jgi:uncharacterized protein with HEPN domain